MSCPAAGEAVCHYLTGGPKAFRALVTTGARSRLSGPAQVEHQVHSQEDDNKLTLALS